MKMQSVSAWYDPITSNYLVLVSLEWLHTGYPSHSPTLVCFDN